MNECEKYNIITDLVPQGKDKEELGKYFEHIDNCPSCRYSYRRRLKLDNLVRETMVQPTLPHDLQSRIFQDLVSSPG